MTHSERPPLIPLNPIDNAKNVAGLWADLRDRMLPHKLLVNAIEAASVYAQDESPLKGQYLQTQFSDFRNAVSTVPGYKGVFGTGYPFYALKDSGGTHPVPEISRYTASFIPRIEADAARGYGAWICGACQIEADLPDLKMQCKPCKDVDLKPRDIFKALPDLDYWVVIDPPYGQAEAVEGMIQAKVQDAGFYTSDRDITQAVDDTLYTMRTLERGNMPLARLPLDLHVVTKDQVIDCIDQVPAALAKHESVPITPRSLHVTWEDTDKPYDFTKDFLFSLTPSDWTDPELVHSLAAARHSAKALVGDNVVNIVADMAPKESRQLETKAIQDCLKKRVQQW